MGKISKKVDLQGYPEPLLFFPLYVQITTQGPGQQGRASQLLPRQAWVDQPLGAGRAGQEDPGAARKAAALPSVCKNTRWLQEA